MQEQEILAGQVLELRRGTIVLCVLSRLQQPMYGYNLVTALSQSGLPVEANTLYPLLRRLEGQGLLESRWETGGTKPRKYYQTTLLGKEIFTSLKQHWQDTVQSVSTILQEDEK
ncbi:MAG: PadR family transcriptional regulator [Oscillospiraceae bacterium]